MEPFEPSPFFKPESGPTGEGLRSAQPSDKLFADLTDSEIEAAVDNAEAGTRLELPGQNPNTGEGLVKVKIKGNPDAAIPHHDNMTFKGIEDAPPGEKIEVRRHSANPNAPEGSYSRDNPTTQINSAASKRYRLPDGSYKRIADMTAEERAAAHIE